MKQQKERIGLVKVESCKTNNVVLAANKNKSIYDPLESHMTMYRERLKKVASQYWVGRVGHGDHT